MEGRRLGWRVGGGGRMTSSGRWRVRGGGWEKSRG